MENKLLSIPTYFEKDELPVLLINMDNGHFLTTWSDLQMRFYESVVEQDHRLQMICVPNYEYFQEIVRIDKAAANEYDIIKSHPIAMYLKKSVLCPRQSTKINKTLIYERKASFSTPNAIGKLNMYESETIKYLKCEERNAYMQRRNVARKRAMLKKQKAHMKNMNTMKIEPRRRWRKLYDRNPPFKAIQELLSVEISNKITQL